MKVSFVPVAIAVAITAASILSAQVPSAPLNLRTVSKTAGPAPTPCIIPPEGGPANAYFDALVRRAEHHCNWSLRSQSQLDDLVADASSTRFTYDPTGDDYPDKQDAAKLVVPPGGSSSIPGTQQLVMRLLPVITSGSVLITWDWYWGKEFQTNRGGVNFYKTWQVMVGDKGWWTVYTMFAWAMDASEVGRAANSIRAGTLADGTVSRDTWTPNGPGTLAGKKAGNSYPVHHSKWTRYWVEVKLLQPPSAFSEWAAAHNGGVQIGPNPNDPAGRWHMVSLYLADEDRDVQRIMHRVPVNYSGTNDWDPEVTKFRFEMNTSQPPGTQTGPMIGYARNTVVLRDYQIPAVPEADKFLFQKPLR